MNQNRPIATTKRKQLAAQVAELEKRKAELRQEMEARIKAVQNKLDEVEIKKDDFDNKLDQHGLCSLAGLLIKFDRSGAEQLFADAKASGSLPAGHDEAIRYAIDNRPSTSFV